MDPDQTTRAALTRAMSLIQSSRWSEAEAVCRQLLEQHPRLPEADYLLGVLYQHTGQTDRAITCFESVAQQIDNHPDALNNLGTLFESRGDTARALDHYKAAADTNPGHLLANYNYGRLLRVSGQPEKAIPYFNRALGASSESEQVRLELGLALKALGKLDEALEQLIHARDSAPNDATIRNIIGNILQSQGQIEQSIKAYQDAIRLKPDFSVAFNNLGSALTARGDIVAALDSYRTALQLRPGWPGAISNLLLAENYIVDDGDLDNLAKEHQKYGTLLEATCRRHLNPATRRHGQKIRVGYVSPDFRAHSVAYFLKALFLHHNHSQFEIICFSDVASPDTTTSDLKSLVSGWQNIYGLSDSEVYQRVNDCNIDILVDLAGHTANNRLPVFAMRAAPVQVSYLGYPNTSGLNNIGYRITDALSDPAGKSDSRHTEQLIRLPGGFLCYTPPRCPDVKPLPADKNKIVTFGSFNVLAKMSDACIETWSAILAQSADSRLLIKSAGLQDQVTREYIHERFRAHNIPRERVELIARTANFDSHMELYNRIDISLDTFPYNGTTTICESLWMGVPVISLAGKCHAGRVGASLLHRVELDQYVADSVSDYVSKAKLLAGDRKKLRIMREQLRSTTAHSALCDGPRIAREIEAAYKEILL